MSGEDLKNWWGDDEEFCAWCFTNGYLHTREWDGKTWIEPTTSSDAMFKMLWRGWRAGRGQGRKDGAVD